MGRFNDLTGKRYGRLTVIERTDDKIYGHRKAPRYLCKCDCGNMTKVCAEYLRSGETKSCGCLRVERMKRGIK